jgi:hypothetical protein
MANAANVPGNMAQNPALASGAAGDQAKNINQLKHCATLQCGLLTLQ